MLLRFINFIVSIILARLLEPSNFGIVALALVVVNFFETIRDFGIGSALIHSDKDIDVAADTAFFIFPSIAIALYIVSYLIAPTAATFFREDELTIIIRVLSFSFVIWSFGSLPSTLLYKNLDFKKLIIPDLLPKICYGIVTIILASQGFGVWSLIIGRLVLEVLSVVTIWNAVKWRPTFKFNREIAVSLLNYGKYVLISGIVVFFISTIDTSIIGRELGSESLGYYTLAFSISSMFTVEVSRITSNVIFPAYAKIQDNIEKIGQAYFNTLKYISIVIFPSAIGIVLVAWYFIKLVYGDKWLPVVTVLQVLCFSGLSTSILRFTEDLYLAVGKPKIVTKIKFFQLIIMLILIYPLTVKYGILGAAITLVISSTVVLMIALSYSAKIINIGFLTIVKAFLPSATGSLTMALIVITFQKLSSQFSPFLTLTFSICLGMSSYFVFFLLKQKEELLEIKKLMSFSKT